MSFSITKARSPEDLSIVSSLFVSYTDWLAIDLSYQDFRTELASLPGKYSPPGGEILLARSPSTQEPLGCVALRPLFPSSNCCEMKRLYVAPAGRGLGVGRALVREILGVAKQLGYKEVKLDTLPQMEAAVGLYEKEGFVRCEKYYETPIEGTLFLAKKL